MSAAEAVPETPVWELNGDQYELFPLPAGPSRMFRKLLGQPDPAPELIAQEPDELGVTAQYEIFPELGAALKPKAEPPADMVDDAVLFKLQDVLNPSAASLGSLLEEASPAPAAPVAFEPVVQPTVRFEEREG